MTSESQDVSLKSAHPKAQGQAAKADQSLLFIACCICLGVVLSALAYRQNAAIDQDRLHQRVLRGTDALAVYSSLTPPSATLIKINSTLQQIQQEVLSGQPMSQEFLQGSTFPADPDTGESVNLRYVPRVIRNRENNRFELVDTSGAHQEFPHAIVDTHPQKGLVPVSDRGEYYPILLQASTGIDLGVNALGLNHFYDDQLHLIMDQARDTGLLNSRYSWPLTTETALYVIAQYYVPLYTPGPMPQTVIERRERHTGFISAISFAPVEAHINLIPDSLLGLEVAFIWDSDVFRNQEFDPELQAIMASQPFARGRFSTDFGDILLFSRPSFSLQNATVTANRWWSLSIGLLLTAWMCSMLYMLRHRTHKLSALIEEKTHDLLERSQRLGEVNEALRESENRYRMLADNANDVIFTHDVNGICTYISPSITQQNGFAVETYIGQPIYQHLCEESMAGAKRILQKYRPVFEGKDSVPPSRTFESHTYCKDGSVKTLETTVTVLCDDGGNAVAYLGVSRDITERKHNEKEKDSLKAAFHQAQKMEAIGTLAGGVAHDFNNLLTGILGHAELLKTNRSGPQVELSIETIETAAIRGRELTSKLLGFARKGHYQNKPVSINRLLRDGISFLQRTVDKHIEIIFTDCKEELVVSGDLGQISQVFLNLALNARDAMPNGGTLTIQLSKETLDQSGDNSRAHSELKCPMPGNYCKVIVADTGIGIAKSELNRIFEPFYTNKPKGKGSGLGLAMVYGVTETHGGTVTVQSEEGIGTCFTVYLPLSTEQCIEPENANDNSDNNQVASGHGNILVVDDEDLVRGLVKEMLSNLGYRSAFAVDGLDGVNYYRQHQSELDLVIVDMNMPKMGGPECVDHLVKINPDVKIILSSGYSQESIAKELQKPNVLGFLQKPFRLKELAQIIADVLGQGGKVEIAKEDVGEIEIS